MSSEKVTEMLRITDGDSDYMLTLYHSDGWMAISKVKVLKNGGLRFKELCRVPASSILKLFTNAEVDRQWLERYGRDRILVANPLPDGLNNGPA